MLDAVGGEQLGEAAVVDVGPGVVVWSRLAWM